MGDLGDERAQERAQELDVLLAEIEQLLEDNGDLEDGDGENDELSEVDEDGAHEHPTELPEDEVHDDDLDFAYQKGRYDPEGKPRFHDEGDEDLDVLWRLER